MNDPSKTKARWHRIARQFFILHLMYPLYCVLHLACFPFIFCMHIMVGLAIISVLWWPFYDATWCIVVHINPRLNCRRLWSHFLRLHKPDLQLVSSREGEPAANPRCLNLLMGGFRFVAYQSSLVCNSWSKKVAVVLPQIQKSTNITYNFRNK